MLQITTSYSYLGYIPKSALITSITLTLLIPSAIPILRGFNINRKTNYIYNSELSPGLLYVTALILKYIVYL
jgi:TRAP-type mannitol/chloroaromatic compound transport system permease large subunit